VLDVTAKPVDAFTEVEICSDETYLWTANDQTYTDSGTYTVVNDGCTADQILVIDITPKPATQSTNAEICSNESYFWPANGQFYVESGTYTIVNDGCLADQILVLNVIAKPSEEVTLGEMCSDGAYLWSVNNQTYTQAGTYTETNDGCTANQVLILDVTPKPLDNITQVEICEGETYLWQVNGEEYTEATIATVVNDGCTADEALELTVVMSPDPIVTDVKICVEDVYLWLGDLYNIGGTYVNEGATVCDPDSVLNLTVLPFLETLTTNASICDGEEFLWEMNEETYTETTTVYDVIQVDDECRLVILQLVVNEPSGEIITDATICSGETYEWVADGESYLESGTYFADGQGCDEGEVLNLEVIPKPLDNITNEEMCQGLTYEWYGEVYSESGIYREVTDGCTADEVLVLDITAKPADNVTNIVLCEGETYLWPINGVEYSSPTTDQVTNDGCTADELLDITVVDSPEPIVTTVDICVEDVYFWLGTPYNVGGTYIQEGATVCDPDSILNLTVLPFGITEVIDHTICEGEEFVWEVNGITYTEAATVFEAYQVADECRLVVLQLQVSGSVPDSITQDTICQGESYEWNGEVYTESGTYTVPNEGCVATQVLELQVTPTPETIVDVISLCGISNAYTWSVNGVTYTQSTTVTVEGLGLCDPDRQLDLKITTDCAELGNKVWIDENGDGIQDAGEPGLPGTIVELYDVNVSSTVPVAMLSTDSTGSYLFTDLPSGDYFLGYTFPLGYSNTESNRGPDTTEDSDVDGSNGPNTTPTTNLSTGESDMSWDAGVVTGAKIGDYVWIDTDGLLPNQQDSEDKPFEGVLVNLYLQDGSEIPTQVGSRTTDKYGRYCFNNVTATQESQSYFLEFITPSGYTIVQSGLGSTVLQGSGGRTIPFTVESGETNLSFDAGYVQILALENTTFQVEYFEKENLTDISWITTNEDYIDYYILEKAYDSANFIELVRFDALEYNGATYSIEDEDLYSGTHYYRLQVVNHNGEVNYSEIKAIQVAEAISSISVSIYPNPMIEYVNINIENGGNQLALICIFDDSGREVYRESSCYCVIYQRYFELIKTILPIIKPSPHESITHLRKCRRI